MTVVTFLGSLVNGLRQWRTPRKPHECSKSSSSTPATSPFTNRTGALQPGQATSNEPASAFSWSFNQDSNVTLFATFFTSMFCIVRHGQASELTAVQKRDQQRSEQNHLSQKKVCSFSLEYIPYAFFLTIHSNPHQFTSLHQEWALSRGHRGRRVQTNE